MTKEELIDACSMRINGHTLQEIADKYHMSKQGMQQSLIHAMRSRPRDKYVFPRIAHWMSSSGETQHSISQKTGINQTTISTYLSGKSSPSMRFISEILKISGMTFEEAFFKEEDDG